MWVGGMEEKTGGVYYGVGRTHKSIDAKPSMAYNNKNDYYEFSATHLLQFTTEPPPLFTRLLLTACPLHIHPSISWQ